MAVDPALLDWLLDSDPALRWQVERDLAGAPPEVWRATRARIPAEGFGARLLALQDPDGQWAGGEYFPRALDCCINGYTLANGVWLGADVSGIAEWFLAHRMSDGGGNCEWVEGSTRSSFHSTLNSLKGLLYYEAATGGTDALRAARHRAEDYLA
jgi:hypothetical protein